MIKHNYFWHVAAWSFMVIASNVCYKMIRSSVLEDFLVTIELFTSIYICLSIEDDINCSCLLTSSLSYTNPARNYYSTVRMTRPPLCVLPGQLPWRGSQTGDTRSPWCRLSGWRSTRSDIGKIRPGEKEEDGLGWGCCSHQLTLTRCWQQPKTCSIYLR